MPAEKTTSAIRLASRRFSNLDGSMPQTFSSIVKWAFVDRILGRRRRSPSRAEVPTTAVNLQQIATAPGIGQGARLTWLGHASWLVQLDGLSLLIDPVFSRSIGPGIHRNIPAPLAIESLPPVAAQLVTHNHRDHLDLASLRQVKAPIVTGLGHAWLGKKTSRKVIELDWWEQTRIGPLEITYVPAQHWSRRGLFDSNHSLWGGFVIKGSSACLYHAGDTAWFDGYAQIAARFPGIDAALLPIGAYDPAWFMQKQHVSPEQAVQAFVELGARRFVAMHWGTFKLSDEPLDEPPQLLRKEWERRGLACEALCIPAQGETLMVGGSGVSS